MDYAVDFDIVTKAGAWFSYGEQRMGQGKDAAKNFLNDNPELQEEIKQKVMQAIADNTGKGKKTPKPNKGEEIDDGEE